MTDGEMLNLMNRDPSEGIRTMVERYSPLVYTIAYSKLGHVFSGDDIEEFVSCIFSRIYEKRGEIDLSRGSVKGYISTVARRMCIDEYRKHAARPETVCLEDEQAEHMTDGRDLQADAERRLDEQALVSALEQLAATDRTVLVRKYYYNQSAAQIAKAMHMTDAAVISRAMEKVRIIMLNQEGTQV